MQGIDGFETAQLIRSREKSRHTPIIFMTAFEANRLPVEEAYALGAVDYLVKPVVPVVLKAKVTQFIDLFEKTEQVRRQAEQLRQLERRQAEQLLRDSQARHTAILEAALDAIVTIDHHSKVIEFNPAAEAMFGHDRTTVVGRPLAELIIPPGLRELHDRGLAHYLKAGETTALNRRMEVTARHADGSEFPIEMAITRISRDGPPLFTAYIRDISQRLRSEKTRSLLAAIVESSEDAIIGQALDGTIESWNPGAEHIYGYTPEEMVGQSIVRIIPPERREELQTILGQLQRGEPIKQMETVRLRKDGRLIDVALSVSPIRDRSGRIIGCSGIARDITQTKRLEEQFRQAQKMESAG
jgi:PAS domain S-box-containing protein